MLLMPCLVLAVFYFPFIVCTINARENALKRHEINNKCQEEDAQKYDKITHPVTP